MYIQWALFIVNTIGNLCDYYHSFLTVIYPPDNNKQMITVMEGSVGSLTHLSITVHFIYVIQSNSIVIWVVLFYRN